MVEPITASCLLVGDDFGMAAQVHRRTRPSRAVRLLRSLTLGVLIVFTLIAIAGILRAIRQGGVARGASLTPGLIFMGLGWAMLFSAPRITRWRAKRQARRFTEAQRNQSWIFDDEGMLLDSPMAEALLRWGYFRRIVESRDLFLIYPTDKQYHVIPARAFRSAEMAGRFAELARRHVADYVVSEPCRPPSKPAIEGLGDF